MVWGLFLGRWGGDGPWFEGFGELFIVGLVLLYFLRGGVSRPRGPASPRCGRVCFDFISIFGVLGLAFCLKKQKTKIIYI